MKHFILFLFIASGLAAAPTTPINNPVLSTSSNGIISFAPANLPAASATETGQINLNYSGTLPDDNNSTYGMNYQWSGPAGVAGANVRAMNTYVTATGTTNLSQLTLWAFRSVNGLTSGTVTNQEFAAGTVRITGGGDTSNGYGYRMQAVASSTGKFANFFKNFEARSPSITGGSTNPLSYGFYSAAQKVTGITTGYGFYQAGASDINVFEGVVSKATGSNGQLISIKSLTELTTIAASATTTTTIQLPANAIILSVSVRVTTVIPTATTFSVGDAGSATRYSTANVSTAANSTDVGTKAGAYYNASATGVLLTMNGGTPAANTGRVRVTIAYIEVTAPTS